MERVRVGFAIPPNDDYRENRMTTSEVRGLVG